MTASQTIQKLGIIAGGGKIPALLCDACANQNIAPVVIQIEDQADGSIDSQYVVATLPLTKAGQMIDLFKSQDIDDLVLIGSVHRPSLSFFKADLKTAAFLAKVGIKSLGDNSLLTAVKSELEHEGFNVYGAHAFMGELLTPSGDLTKMTPNPEQLKDIEMGVPEALELGKRDIGQAVIIHNEQVVAREDEHGTDAMIDSVKTSGQAMGGILVKMCKPQQDEDLDLPTIGLQTVQNCIDAGMVGIIVEAERSFLVDRDAMIKLADSNGLFIRGVSL